MLVFQLDIVRQTCVVEVGQQLFFLHKSLIQPVSQGLWLHRNLFYWVHPEEERGRADRKMKHTSPLKKRITEVSLSKNCLHWSVVEAAVQTQGVSRGPWAEQSIPDWSLLQQTVFAVASVCIWGFISQQAHHCDTGRQKCWGEPWQQTDSSTKWLG